jgi:DNA (cytosine-5)-methyltransferase 1
VKILNLYAGIGGNRKLWPDGHEITVVEMNPDIAAIYQDFFPDDNVIVGDAHEYLLNHYAEFDFIWASPPCPTHSQIRYGLGVKNGQVKAVYPDMKLYQEIILLEKYFEGYYVVENVIPFYEPLIKGQKLGRHLYWSNFHINQLDFEIKSDEIKGSSVKSQTKNKKIDLSKYKVKNKEILLKNMVNPELGLHIFNCIPSIKDNENFQQTELFN